MVQLRPARPADDAVICDLAESEGARVDPVRERALPHSILLVATQRESENLPIGFILGWAVADELELLDLVVEKSARRQGVAGRLIEALFELGRARGAEAAFLEVRVGNEAAQALYRQFGFQAVGQRARYYPDGEDAELFRCCLSRGG